ncbi:MAG: hypothetical protein WCS89_02130 [Candidatus Paceibacterota bacterium]|jgi:hypothetical protein
MLEGLEDTITETNLSAESNDIFEFKDEDGDKSIGVIVGEYIVFATEQIDGKWTVNFALKDELKGSSWMDTLTNKGAFSTIIELKPAFEKIINQLEKEGKDWFCACDERRAKLYARYIPKEKIQIVDKT